MGPGCFNTHVRERLYAGEHPRKSLLADPIGAAVLDRPLILEQIGAHHGRGGERDHHRYNNGR